MLNDVVVDMVNRVEALEQRLEHLRKQILTLAPSPVGEPDQEDPPPHY